MYVQFLTPDSSTGTVPAGLKARIALISPDPALTGVSIGGISLWEGDGSKPKHPKGVLEVGFPKYGVISGTPVKIKIEDEAGEVSYEYRPSTAGKQQLAKIAAAILTCWTDALRAGSDPFIGRFELALPRPAFTQANAVEGIHPTDDELEALTAPATT